MNTLHYLMIYLLGVIACLLLLFYSEMRLENRSKEAEYSQQKLNGVFVRCLLWAAFSWLAVVFLEGVWLLYKYLGIDLREKEERSDGHEA